MACSARSSDHASVFGHVTAFAEIAIGLGLLVGLLTRIAAAGGMVLMAAIVLSASTGAGSRSTPAPAAGSPRSIWPWPRRLSVYLLGGADPFSLDAVIWQSPAAATRAVDDAEPGFHDNALAESRARLQGEPTGGPRPAERAGHRTAAPPPAEPETNSLWNEGRSETRHRPMEQVDPAAATRRFRRPLIVRPLSAVSRPVRSAAVRATTAVGWE